MKMFKSSHWLRPLAIALTAGSVVATSQAQPYANFIADQFDTDTSGDFDNNSWGTASPTITWDGTQNAVTTMGPNNAGSGSLDWQIAWPLASGDQIMVTRGFNNGAILNLNDYTNVSFDIMFAPNCATDGQGSYGVVEIGCSPQSDGWPSTALGDYYSAVANGNGWIHVVMPINASSNPKLSAISAWYVKMQQSKTGGNVTGTTAFWLDNVIFGGLTNLPPPPTVSISKNTNPAGLLIVCGGSGGTYTRGLMMAFDTANGTRNFSWVGSGSTPVSYSQTIAAYPDASHAIQSAIFLVQNGNYGDPGVDYDAANVAQLSIYGNTNGTATGSFQYKTNQADGNSQFSANTLATLTAPSPLGTWSLTFLDDTNVILGYEPLGGGSGLFVTNSFPSDTTVQTYFANPLSVFMGDQQNADANLGQSATYSEFKISGVTASPALDDVWSTQTTLDTTNWGKVDDAFGDILLVHPTDKYWVSWSLPDAGYSVVVSTNLAAGAAGWVDGGISQRVPTTTNNRVLLPSLSTNFPSAATTFISLVSRTATKLQVLWPGETNAPGTATGKIGSPAPVAAGDNVTVTVNAVDNTWHIVNVSGDNIHFTAASSSVTVPPDAALASGSLQGTVTFGNSGAFTITATDTTTTNVTAGTSSTITAN
jgi:hypothetical protein